MNRDLFLAVLSMDAYNRGYGARLSNLPESGALGNANIINRASLGIDGSVYQNWQAANFYAIAYDWNGEKIVSYRGTDNLTEDAFNSYAIAVGDPLKPQGTMAVQFYKAVVGVDANGNLISNPLTQNITLVGHSLGGGLAGYIASLYNRPAAIFDNMPFELASAATHAAALTNEWIGIGGAQEFLYGSMVNVPAIDRSGISGDYPLASG